MADARLGVLIVARDEASAVLRALGAELTGLEGKTGAASGFAKLGESISGVAKTAAGFALGGLALNIGGDIAEQFQEVLTHTVALGRGVRRLQLDVGGTAEEISGLLAVFNRFGVEGEGAERTLSLFSRGLRGDISASESSTQNAKTFSGTLAELGVEAADANGRVRPMQSTLLDVADGFKAHATDGQNAARAMALFGRSGRDLLPVLVLGRDGILELEAEAKKLGLVLTQDNVDSVRLFVKEQKNMNEAIEGLKVQLGVGLLPLFEELAKAGSDWAKSLNADGGKSIKELSANLKGLIQQFMDLNAEVDKAPKPGAAGAALGNAIPGADGKGLAGAAANLLAQPGDLFERLKNTVRDQILGATGHPDLIPTPPAASLQRQGTAGQDARDAIQLERDKAAAAAAGNAELDDQATTKKQIEELDKKIAATEREAAQVQHDISLKTRESLDLKRTEAELQLQLLPLKAEQADIEQQLLMATDKRAGLERDAAVARAQQASNASADALEGIDFEERRLKLKIKADAIGGRGVAASDIATLIRLGSQRPQAELAALEGGRPLTLAERERQRAQQAQELATLPLRERAADIEASTASLKAQSDAVQRQIEEARLHGVVDTTDLQKRKQALDDQLFTQKQAKSDLTSGVAVTINQTITSGGDIDYERVITMTQAGVFGGLAQAQANVSMPAPSFSPGSRGSGTTGPF